MTDIEARIFITEAVAQGLRLNMPQTEPERVQKIAADLVNTIVDNYQRCRLLGADKGDTQ